MSRVLVWLIEYSWQVYDQASFPEWNLFKEDLGIERALEECSYILRGGDALVTQGSYGPQLTSLQLKCQQFGL